VGFLRTRLRMRHLLLAITIAVVALACSQNTSDVLISTKSSLEPCRMVKHGMGETCIPLNPQRIIALAPEYNLDPLIALEIRPIGFTSYSIGPIGREKEALFGASWSDVSGAQSVGNVYQPSLEKILTLKPDLILGYSQLHHYQLLSAIAPTVPVPDPYDNSSTNDAYFKINLQYIANLLDRETKAEEVLDQYQQRVKELKKRLGSRLQELEVSVISYSEGVIHTIGKQNRYPAPGIFNDIGLRYKFSSRDGGLEPKLSIEEIGEYDADVLFIVNVAERLPSFYFQHPMFRSLKAVQDNRAYIVDQETWGAQGILGANRILDDLFKYLINTP
jgi:iron complex transport system substrate-binding protein